MTKVKMRVTLALFSCLNLKGKSKNSNSNYFHLFVTLSRIVYLEDHRQLNITTKKLAKK